MILLEGLFGVDSKEVLDFFTYSMQDQLLRQNYKTDELHYVAHVLALYAQVPWDHSVYKMVGTELSQHLYTHLFGQECVTDPEVLEGKGSYILLMAGFFRSQMRIRHNVELYDKIGQSYYLSVCKCTSQKKKGEFFKSFAGSFPFWTHMCSNLYSKLQEERFVLRLE